MKSMTVYDSIGNNYNSTRQADERILSSLVSLLKCRPPSLIADIGAGTGNYSRELSSRGYLVHALEPSETMRQQRKNHPNLLWFDGFAEQMPFGDDAYDGVICTMATHHFSSLEASFREMHRILKKKAVLVIFTADLRLADAGCWIRNYFPRHYDRACDLHPDIASFRALAESIFASPAAITHFPLPHDLKDGFFYSAWRYPERYLSADFRNGISCFALVDSAATDEAIRRLERDLAGGAWDAAYRGYRDADHYNGGYYFLSITK